MWRTTGYALLAALVLGLPVAGQDGPLDPKTVKLEDSKGVVTYATNFGKAFGAEFLSGYRGDSKVDIPFERIVSIRNGTVVDSRMPVSLVLTSGRGLEIELDRPEFETVYGGQTDFGNIRIRMQEIRYLEYRKLENRTEGLGQRCASGHVWYNDTWRYCPFDGKALKPILRSERPAEEHE